jgi:hypothetical protein
MAKSWQQVTQLPEFQSLSDEEKENWRDEYFYDVVLPKGSSIDDEVNLRAQFDAETAPKTPKLDEPQKEDNWWETVDKFYTRSGMRMIKQAGGILQDTADIDRQFAGSAAQIAKKGLGPSTVFDAVKMATSLPRVLANRMNPEAAQKTASTLRAQGEDMIRGADVGLSDPSMKYKNKDGSLKYYVGHGGEMLLGNILPMMAVGVVAGPQSGLGLMFGQVYGESYADAINKGREPELASMDATFNAVSEVLTEAGPLGAALKPGSKFLRRLVETTGKEALGEVLNAVAQRAYDTGIVDEKTDIKEFMSIMMNDEALREYRDSLVLGGGAGTVMTTIGHPATVAQEKAAAQQMKDIASNLAFDQINDSDLNYMVENGARMADTYGDPELASAVEAFAAEQQLRAEGNGQDVRSMAGNKRKGPLARAVERGAASVAGDINTDDETGLATGQVEIAPGANEIETTREPLSDINAQLEAMNAQDVPKDSVFVANGTPMPGNIPKNAIVVQGQSGTLITTNRDKAELFQADESDRTIADILGYTQSKNEMATAIAAGERARSLIVRDGQGNVIHQEAVTESRLDEAKTKLNQQYPGRVEIHNPEDVLQERANRVMQEDQAGVEQEFIVEQQANEAKRQQALAEKQHQAQQQAQYEQMMADRDQAILDLMPDDQAVITRTDGQPFLSYENALQAAKNKRLNIGQDSAIIPHQNGYAIVQLNDEQKAEQARIESEFMAQQQENERLRQEELARHQASIERNRIQPSPASVRNQAAIDATNMNADLNQPVRQNTAAQVDLTPEQIAEQRQAEQEFLAQQRVVSKPGNAPPPPTPDPIAEQRQREIDQTMGKASVRSTKAPPPNESSGPAIERRYNIDVRKQDNSPSARARRARQIDWENDDLITVIRKLGGLNVGGTDGTDTGRDFKGRLKHLNDNTFGLPSIEQTKKGHGMTLEQLAEYFGESDILNLKDGLGNIDSSILYDLLEKASTGEKVYLNTSDPKHFLTDGMTFEEAIDEENARLEDENESINQSYQEYFESYRDELERIAGEYYDGSDLMALESLVDEAKKINPDKTEGILGASADVSDITIAAQLIDLINGERYGRTAQKDTAKTQEPRQSVQAADTGRSGTEGGEKRAEQGQQQEVEKPVTPKVTSSQEKLRTEAGKFKPTHETSDGQLVEPTPEDGVWVDADGNFIEDEYATAIEQQAQPVEAVERQQDQSTDVVESNDRQMEKPQPDAASGGEPQVKAATEEKFPALPQVKEQVKYVIGRGPVSNFAGPRHADARADILSTILGEKVPKSKAGVTRLKQELYNLAGMPVNVSEAEREKLFAAWLWDEKAQTAKTEEKLPEDKKSSPDDFQLTNETSEAQQLADLEAAKDAKRNGTNKPEPAKAQSGDDLFANDGKAEPDLFAEDATQTPETKPKKGVALSNIVIQQEIDGERIAVNADVAFKLATDRLDELAALRDCVNG